MSNETRPLLSRTAEAVYWMARYIERAENVARFIGVNLNLQLDLPFEPTPPWQSLIEASGDAEAFRKRYGVANQANVITFLTLDMENPSSICCCLQAARECARSVRETISSPMWEQLNSMYLQIRSQHTLPDPEFLRSIRRACHMFQGTTDAAMSHNEAWHFLRLGGKIERADKTSRILDVKYFILLPSAAGIGTPYDDIHWSAVLKSVSGFEMYRKRHGRISPRDIVDFLLMDREFPRAIHHCVCAADESLHAITGTPMGSFVYPSERLLGLLRSELNFTSVDDVIRFGLHEYLDGLQMKLNAIGDSLHEDFFARYPVGPAVPAGGNSRWVETSSGRRALMGATT